MAHLHANVHETRDADPRVLIWSAVALAVSVIFALLVVWGAFNYFKYVQEGGRDVTLESNPPAAVPDQPPLEVDATMPIQQLRAREDHILNTYAVVDQQRGTVRIPIQRAMDLLLQRGLPVRTGDNRAK